jgi:hypothetical protein
MSETPTLPAVPPMNLNAIREALKAHGVTLNDVQIEVDCTCDVCGATWSEEASLENRLRRTWWSAGSAMRRTRKGAMMRTPEPLPGPRISR